MLTNPSARDRRRPERAEGLEVIEVEIAGSDGRRIGVIRDRTAYGIRAQFRNTDDLPKMITIYSRSIGDGVPAMVCWQRGRDVGIRFCTPIL